MREVIIGATYKHFKGHIVKVICIGKDAENLVEKVIYEHIDTKEVWVRDKDEFLSKVDKIKYPDVKATYRFELEEC